MNILDIITEGKHPDMGEQLEQLVAARLPEFKKVLNGYRGSQVGGISVSEAFWLFCLLDALQPRQAIESGTFHGFSLWIITRAVTRSCRVLAFDPDLSHTERYDGVEFHEHDWLLSDKGFLEGEGTVVFFDDHIDHDRRLYEAVHANQKHLLFHDNYLTTGQSHRPIRFCDLADADLCYTFPALNSDRIFVDRSRNAQTYRWLTYVRRACGE